MKIVFGIPFLYPAIAYGGAARAAYELASALQQRGHEIVVLTTDVWDASSRWKPNGFQPPFQVIRLRNLSNWAAYHLQFYTPMDVAEESERTLSATDIVHLHTFRNLLNDILARKAEKHHIPFVISGHGTIPRIERFQAIKSVYDFALGNWQLENASGFLAVSEKEAGVIRSFTGTRVQTEMIPNGVSEFELPESGMFRKKWSIAPDEKVILFLGKITRRKGVQHLVRAYSAMRAEARLVIAGNDMGYGSRIRTLIDELNLQDRVVCTGLLRDSEKYQALCDADVTVYPSIHEVFGLVPLESLSCGTPVIVCGDDGCGEMIRKTGGGETVSWADPEGLRFAIRAQLQRGKNRDDISVARRYIQEHYRWPVVAQAVEKFYESVLSGR